MPKGKQGISIPDELLFEDPPARDAVTASCLRLLEHPNRWAIVATFDTASGAGNRAKTLQKRVNEAQSKSGNEWGTGKWEFLGTEGDEDGQSVLRAIYRWPVGVDQDKARTGATDST